MAVMPGTFLRPRTGPEDERTPFGKQPDMHELIKPFVGRIEYRDGDVDNFHLTDGAVAAAGLDHNARHRLDGESLAVQFDLAFPFEHDINLSHPFVVVRSRVLRDFDAVHARR